ncbi:MAG: NAD(P)-binding domain-containing protein [Pseudomonadales bacterium]|nr:NAD(P)-binding domain-containing protein [Pseudomonadales bacterium]
MKIIDKKDLYCVIGAGPSGLVAAKNLLQRNIPCEIIEKHDDIGGIWNIKNPQSTVYDNTYTITSREITAYTDFPFPEDSGDYIHHTKVLDYLRDYAVKNDLSSIIRFNMEVSKLERQGEFWEVTCGGTTYLYKGVVVANGHNWYPKYPDYSGDFTGEIIHSSSYKNPDNLKGKDVLVVGAGNTGCDIAVEAAHYAKSTSISMRRGYYFVPKYIFGIPADKLGQNSQSTAIPLSFIRFVYKLLLKLTMGNPQRYGLPKPDHELLESPPIVNNLLPYYVAHKRVNVTKDVDHYKGNTVHFTDGTSKDIDTVIYATGYQIVFPFIDKKYLNWEDGKPNLYLMAFHPEYNNFFVAGLTDGTGGHFPTVDLQTQIIANYLRAKEDGHKFASEIEKRKSNGNWDFSRGIRFIESSRSLTQFELVSFRKHMLGLIGSYSPA